MNSSYSGHLLVYKEIMQYVKNKNPKSDIGFTPLHYAAQEGHLDICKHIFEHVENKNTSYDDGSTPLHAAA